MLELWNQLLYFPLVNSLVWLHQLTGSLGWAIVILTAGLRVAMTPLILPGLKLSKKVQDLAPELNKLKEKYKDDKTALMTAQAELYKQHGANPASGCLPQIVQIVLLIALFNSLNSVLKPNGQTVTEHLNPILYSFNKLPENFQLKTNFVYLDMGKPDVFRIPGLPIPLPGLFVISAALLQVVTAKMMSGVTKAKEKIVSTTPAESDDAMQAASQQMLFMMPLMIVIFGMQFPSGLALYQLALTVVSLVQQYLATGWGGMRPYLLRLNLVK